MLLRRSGLRPPRRAVRGSEHSVCAGELLRGHAHQGARGAHRRDDQAHRADRGQADSSGEFCARAPGNRAAVRPAAIGHSDSPCNDTGRRHPHAASGDDGNPSSSCAGACATEGRGWAANGRDRCPAAHFEGARRAATTSYTAAAARRGATAGRSALAGRAAAEHAGSIAKAAISARTAFAAARTVTAAEIPAEAAFPAARASSRGRRTPGASTTTGSAARALRASGPSAPRTCLRWERPVRADGAVRWRQRKPRWL